MLAASPLPADESANACVAADAATAKDIEALLETKQERFGIRDAANLKPWLEKLKSQAKETRVRTTAALEVCRADRELGPRARRAAVTRLKRRVRVLDETDEQILMMQAFESDPRPQVDTTILERINPPKFPLQ
jgi:hypothetical protein